MIIRSPHIRRYTIEVTVIVGARDRKAADLVAGQAGCLIGTGMSEKYGGEFHIAEVTSLRRVTASSEVGMKSMEVAGGSVVKEEVSRTHRATVHRQEAVNSRIELPPAAPPPKEETEAVSAPKKTFSPVRRKP